MIWLAVLVALLAAAGNNIGKVLQKKGTRGLPLLKLDVKVRRHPIFAVGFPTFLPLSISRFFSNCSRRVSWLCCIFKHQLDDWRLEQWIHPL